MSKCPYHCIKDEDDSDRVRQREKVDHRRVEGREAKRYIGSGEDVDLSQLKEINKEVG